MVQAKRCTEFQLYPQVLAQESVHSPKGSLVGTAKMIDCSEKHVLQFQLEQPRLKTESRDEVDVDFFFVKIQGLSHEEN